MQNTARKARRSVVDEAHAITPHLGEQLPAITAEEQARVREAIARAKADTTRAAYQRDWAAFQHWCTARGAVAGPPSSPELLVVYLTELADAGLTLATVQRRLAAISYAHRLADVGRPSRHPLVKEVLASLRKQLGVSPANKARPIRIDDIRAMVMDLPNTITGTRDRALLLLGFAGAFRESELVALEVSDIEESNDGLRIHIRHSKTDQVGKGVYIGIPTGARKETCPVRAYKEWLRESGITGGAAFRPVNRHGTVIDGHLSPRAVERIVKHAAELAGLDPAPYSGHSLRSGFITTTARAGVPLFDIMRHTRHKRTETLIGYIDKETVLGKNNAARSLGL